MNKKELELEAEKYADDLFGFSNENHTYWEDCQRHFIVGATSKYVEKQKLEFAMLMLNRAKDLDVKTVYLELNKQLSEL